MTDFLFLTSLFIVEICSMPKRTKVELDRLKEWAKLLFTKDNHTQKEIADKVGVSEKTIGKWKEDGKWETFKATQVMSKPEQLNLIYMQINELNQHILKKEEGQRFASSKEADALKKLTSSAKDLEGELGLSAIVDVSTALLEFVKVLDYKASQELHGFIDAFIKEKINA